MKNASPENQPLLLFRVGPVTCCASVKDVEAIINYPERLTAMPGQAAFVAGIFRYRTETASVVCVRAKFGLGQNDSRAGKVVLVRLPRGLTGFLVDEIIEVTSAVDAQWGEPPRLVPTNIFDKTLLYKDGIVLHTTFDQLFTMPLTGPFHTWILQHGDSGGDAATAITGTPAASPGIEADAATTGAGAVPSVEPAPLSNHHSPDESQPTLALDGDSPSERDAAVTSTTSPGAIPDAGTFSVAAGDDQAQEDSRQPPAETPSRPSGVARRSVTEQVNAAVKASPSTLAPRNEFAFSRPSGAAATRQNPAAEKGVATDVSKRDASSPFPARGSRPIVPTIATGAPSGLSQQNDGSRHAKPTESSARRHHLTAASADAPVSASLPSVSERAASLARSLSTAGEVPAAASTFLDEPDFADVVSESEAPLDERSGNFSGPMIGLFAAALLVAGGIMLSPWLTSNGSPQGALDESSFNGSTVAAPASRPGASKTSDVIDETEEAPLFSQREEGGSASANASSTILAKRSHDIEMREEEPSNVVSVITEPAPSPPLLSPPLGTHIVADGDTLWRLARQYVQDPFRYPELARMSDIKNPDLIFPGERVHYPKQTQFRDASR